MGTALVALLAELAVPVLAPTVATLPGCSVDSVAVLSPTELAGVAGAEIEEELVEELVEELGDWTEDAVAVEVEVGAVPGLDKLAADFSKTDSSLAV